VAPVKEEKVEVKADKVNAAPYSSGKVASALTSTVMPVETVHQPAILVRHCGWS